MPSILGAAIRLGAVFSESAGGLMKHLLGIGLTLSSLAADEPLECDFTDYRRLAGLSAEAVDGDGLFEWDGAAEGSLPHGIQEPKGEKR